MSVFWTIAIPAAIVYFIMKYHRSVKGRRRSRSSTIRLLRSPDFHHLRADDHRVRLGWVEYGR